MENSDKGIAVLFMLGAVLFIIGSLLNIYLLMIEADLNEEDELLPEMCKVGVVEIADGGYGVFSGVGEENWYMVESGSKLHVFQEPLEDRSNCIEHYGTKT